VNPTVKLFVRQFSESDNKEVVPPQQVSDWQEYIYAKIYWIDDYQLRYVSLLNAWGYYYELYFLTKYKIIIINILLGYFLPTILKSNILVIVLNVQDLCNQLFILQVYPG
jgi:hypothetical protein